MSALWRFYYESATASVCSCCPATRSSSMFLAHLQSVPARATALGRSAVRSDSGWLQRLLPFCLFQRSVLPPLPLLPALRLRLDVLRLLCERYSVHVRRLELPSGFNGPRIDETTGGSVLPPSLAQLWLGRHM